MVFVNIILLRFVLPLMPCSHILPAHFYVLCLYILLCLIRMASRRRLATTPVQSQKIIQCPPGDLDRNSFLLKNNLITVTPTVKTASKSASLLVTSAY